MLSIALIFLTVDGFKENGINIQFIKENFSTLSADGTENEMGNIVLSVMGNIAQMERKRIKERQKEGIAVAKSKGVYIKHAGKKLGYKESTEKFLAKHKDVQLKLSEGLKYRDIAKLTGKGTATITKVAKAMKELQKEQ